MTFWGLDSVWEGQLGPGIGKWYPHWIDPLSQGYHITSLESVLLNSS